MHLSRAIESDKVQTCMDTYMVHICRLPKYFLILKAFAPIMNSDIFPHELYLIFMPDVLSLWLGGSVCNELF